MQSDPWFQVQQKPNWKQQAVKKQPQRNPQKDPENAHGQNGRWRQTAQTHQPDQKDQTLRYEVQPIPTTTQRLRRGCDPCKYPRSAEHGWPGRAAGGTCGGTNEVEDGNGSRSNRYKIQAQQNTPDRKPKR